MQQNFAAGTGDPIVGQLSVTPGEPFLPSGETGTFDTEALYGGGGGDEDAYFGSETFYPEDGGLEFDPESGTFLESPAGGAVAPPPGTPDYFADDGVEFAPGYGN